MRLRVTLTLFAVVALALALAGSASLLLVRHAQSDSAQQRLLNEVRTLAAHPGLADTKYNLDVIQQVAGFASAGSFIVGPKTLSPQPPGVPLSSADAAVLRQGGSLVTSAHHVALAAAPILHGRINNSTVVLYLESSLDFSTENGLYFLLAGVVALLVAAGVASVVSTRIATRVGAVAEAAHQIARGDLSTRVDPASGGTYPELRELDASINTMAANLERAQQVEREFLLSISHEFRTPLTSIRGYSEAIAEGAVAEPAVAAAVVVSESDRLERLIGDLLDLARLRSRQFSFDFALVDLVEVATQVAEALALSFAQRGITLERHLPATSAYLWADRDRLSQIVANLLENAGRFARSRVELRLDVAAGEVTLRVADDGPGIDAEDLPRIFERLFRSDVHANRHNGSGLGLAIVAELAHVMHGEVTAESPRASGPGTELVVCLPLAPAPGES